MNISQQQTQVGKSNNYIDIKYIQYFIVFIKFTVFYKYF